MVEIKKALYVRELSSSGEAEGGNTNKNGAEIRACVSQWLRYAPPLKQKRRG